MIFEPHRECARCPRLVHFRAENRATFPEWHNGPVAPFGGIDAPLLIVGLAPGMKGANRTGRPFTGDYAGDLLYGTLLKFRLASGSYGASHNDGIRLTRCRITNAVRCLPPKNKPLGVEIAACGSFLAAEIAAMKHLSLILALGRIAHDAALNALGERKSRHLFRHGAFHDLSGGTVLADSYHCSRYNTNTGRLTVAMFDGLFARIGERLKI